MPIWSDTYLNQLISDGEEDIARQVPCLFNATSLDIVSGTSTYSLPALYTKVSLVLWKGFQLIPLTQRELHGIDAIYRTNQSTPYYYSVDLDGSGTIRFYPVPNVTVASITTNLFGSEIPNRVIVYYFQTPDTTNTVLTIPKWTGRNVIKLYALWKAFNAEGKGQNIALSDYFEKRYLTEIIDFKNATANLFQAKEASQIEEVLQRPPKPRLPWNFGYNNQP